MPEPGMVQLDPAQKQAPAAVEAFDRRQIILQAKHDVNLLLEKSKSVVESEKGKLENLQIIGSFTVLAKPGHEKETYEIYRVEVNRVNEQLISNKESFDIQLEETSPGKLYVVCGRYEEREPKVAEDRKSTGEAEVPSPMAKPDGAVQQVVRAGEEQGLPQAERITLIISAEDLRKLAISPEELKTIDPDALTEAQWSVLLKLFEQAARNEYGAGYAFKSLFPSQKIDIVRGVLAAVKEEGANSLEFSMKYEENEGRAKYDVKKAAETLSTQRGDCDDLALLYITCIKRLEHGKLLKVDGIRLAVAGYYDPGQEKREESNIRGHANVLHSTMTTKDENSPKATTYLVDLTYHSSSVDLGLQANEITPSNSDLKQKYLEYLNAGRREKDKIKLELFELRIYNGYDGAQAYYCETKGAALRSELDGLVTKASKLREDGKYGEAEKKSADLETKLKELYDVVSDGLKHGQASRPDYGKMLVVFADVCKTRSRNLTNHGSALANLANDERNQETKEKMREQVRADNEGASKLRGQYLESYKMAIDMPSQDSYTLYSVAKHLRFNWGADYLPIAEGKITEAIEKSRFDPEFYKTYLDIMQAEGKTEEAKSALSDYRTTLVKLGVKTSAKKDDAISVIDGLIGE